MADAMANGERVEISGLCSIFMEEYGACTGRNPKTGKQIKIKGRNVVTFKPSKNLP
jgi:integration host factor subunit beta